MERPPSGDERSSLASGGFAGKDDFSEDRFAWMHDDRAPASQHKGCGRETNHAGSPRIRRVGDTRSATGGQSSHRIIHGARRGRPKDITQITNGFSSGATKVIATARGRPPDRMPRTEMTLICRSDCYRRRESAAYLVFFFRNLGIPKGSGVAVLRQERPRRSFLRPAVAPGRTRRPPARPATAAVRPADGRRVPGPGGSASARRLDPPPEPSEPRTVGSGAPGRP